MTTNQQRGDGASGDPRPLTEPQQIPIDNDLGPLPEDEESAQTALGEREQGIRTERSDDISSPQLTGSDNRDSTPRDDEAAVRVGDGVDEGVQDTVRGPEGSLGEPD
jgi:hypothetical protein